MNSFLGRGASPRRLLIVVIWLMTTWGLVCGPPGGAEQSARSAETEQAPGKNEPGKDQPSPPTGPPAQIEGFRQARFGMSEEQVRQAIRKDFPVAGAKPTSAVHPSEKT